jgi:hypothetical protein
VNTFLVRLKAMAHAMIFPEAVKLKRKGSGSLIAKDQFSAALLSQARTVLDFSQELARQVRDGLPLTEAYEKVKAERQRGQSDDTKRAELETEAPDLEWCRRNASGAVAGRRCRARLCIHRVSPLALPQTPLSRPREARRQGGRVDLA